MSSKKKILQYIDYKKITVYEFEKITGLSHGILRSGSDFGADKLKQIRDNLPDLNMNWLIYDEGNMLLLEESPLQTMKMEAVLDVKTVNKDFENLVISIFEKKYAGKLKTMQRQLEIMFQQKLRESNDYLKNNDASNKNTKTG